VEKGCYFVFFLIKIEFSFFIYKKINIFASIIYQLNTIAMNHKIFIPTVFLSLSFFVVNAQTFERKVVSNNGKTLANNSAIIQQTLGQIAVKTFGNQSVTLNQGFQQSEINIVKTDDFLPSVELSFFPNPTTQIVNYKFTNGTIEEASFSIYSINAEFIFSTPLQANGGEINLNNLPDGTYVLHLMSKNKINKSFKIIKLSK
jgi:hypothetical protein